MKVAKWTLALLSAVMMTSCATVKAKPEPVSAVQASEEVSKKSEFDSTVRIEALADYVDRESGERVVGRDVFISIQTPDKLRLTIASFDKTMATLLATNRSFCLLDLVHNQFLDGRATPENISKILPVYATADDLIRLLTGQYPVSGVDVPNKVELTWKSDVGAYMQVMQMQQGEQRVYYSYPDWDIVRVERFKDDKLEMSFEASDFEGVKMIRHPKSVLFTVGKTGGKLRLRIKSYTEGITFGDKVFVLNPPEGVQVIHLSEVE